MELTGQPFVDTGFAIAAHLQGRASVADVTPFDLSSSVLQLKDLLGTPSTQKAKERGKLAKLGVLGTYWHNNPFAGKNISDKTVLEYSDHLLGASQHRVSLKNAPCQICGRIGTFLDVNRSWLPLSASSASDPCSLPYLSGKHICSCCFSAAILLPLGCRILGGSAYLYHIVDPAIIVEAVGQAFYDIQHSLASGATGNSTIRSKTTLSGRSGLLQLTSGSHLWDKNQGGCLTRRADSGVTIISFSNAGTSPALSQLHIPAQALDFFAALDRLSLRDQFLKWAEWCHKKYLTSNNSKRVNDLFDALCNAVEGRKSLAILLRAIALGRRKTYRIISREEKKVLEVYEDIARGEGQRFGLIDGIARRIRNLEALKRDSFLRRLANTRKKESLLRLLCDLAKSDRSALRLSRDEIKMLDLERGDEVVALLYLLCIAEE